MLLNGEILMNKNSLNITIQKNFSNLLSPYESSLESIIQITKAFSFANKVHYGKFQDDCVTPYIGHPIRVALILSEELSLRDEDLICASLLHDVFNHKYTNKVNVDDLKDIINENVYNLIKNVQIPKLSNNITYEQNLENFSHTISKSSKRIQYLVIADRLDNVRMLKISKQKEKAFRYKEETQKYFLPIASQMDDKISFKLSVALYEIK